MHIRRVGRRTALWSMTFAVTAAVLAVSSHYALADTPTQVTGDKKLVLEYVHVANLQEASNDDCAEVYGTITVKHGDDSKDVFNLPYDNITWDSGYQNVCGDGLVKATDGSELIDVSALTAKYAGDPSVDRPFEVTFDLWDWDPGWDADEHLAFGTVTIWPEASDTLHKVASVDGDGQVTMSYSVYDGKTPATTAPTTKPTPTTAPPTTAPPTTAPPTTKPTPTTAPTTTTEGPGPA